MNRKLMRRTHVCAVAALFAVPAPYVQTGRKVRILNIDTARFPAMEMR